MEQITGIILAGGKSRRLKYRNKALLDIGGISCVERVARVLWEVLGKIYLITNSPEELEHLEIPMFFDIEPGKGPLGGIYTGLKVSDTQYNLIVACDIPFIQLNILNILIENINGYEAIVPATPDGLQPTCAIYSKNCIPAIESQFLEGNLKISGFFSLVKTRILGIDRLIDCYDSDIFLNINTYEDYIKALIISENRVNAAVT